MKLTTISPMHFATNKNLKNVYQEMINTHATHFFTRLEKLLYKEKYRIPS